MTDAKLDADVDVSARIKALNDVAARIESSIQAQAGIANRTETESVSGTKQSATNTTNIHQSSWLPWLLTGVFAILPAPFDPLRRLHLQKRILEVQHNGS